MASLTLSSAVGEISHIGRQVTAQLKHLGVLTAQDLLFYFPARYDDLSKVTLISEAKIGQRVVLRGKVELLDNRRSKWRWKLVTQAIVSDATGAIRVVWFNQPWIAKMFKPGDEVYLVGEVKDDHGLLLSSPVYERAGRKEAIHTARIVPVYPATEKLSQKQLRHLVQRVLPLTRSVLDPLPLRVRSDHQLMPLAQAIVQIHFPSREALLAQAQRRLKFDELFSLQLSAALLKRELKKIPAPTVRFNEQETKRFVEGLPYRLTDDQRKAAWEIIQDLGRGRPMNRLLEGEVGSGKTVVVALAALNCVLGVDKAKLWPAAQHESLALSTRGQVAIMAPTEILARQHFKTFSKFLEPHGITVELRTGSEKKSKGVLDANVVIGTHALIQGSVQFKNLVLAVVDEQHRFGVEQRQALKSKREDGQLPHLLSLTATPIPRSLALVFYGDLDISILREMPKGRQRIETVVVTDKSLALSDATKLSFDRVHDFVRGEIKTGHQAFWVCPIIDPSDTLGVRAATEVFEHLKNETFQDLRVGLLHGRMRLKDRERVMGEFWERQLDILVATPVIEVGIDVPNATVMVIEGAQRFGLAQLHQFRGRVGRGEAQSYCLLMVDNPDFVAQGFSPDARPKGLSYNATTVRLQAFLESSDGFALAEKDLALRGPGEVYGTAQSGFPEFKIATFADVEIAQAAKQAVQHLLTLDPTLNSYPQLKETALDKEKGVHLE